VNIEEICHADCGAAVLRQISGNYQLDLNFCDLELLSRRQRLIGARAKTAAQQLSHQSNGGTFHPLHQGRLQ
jgi:hypothetical protein